MATHRIVRYRRLAGAALIAAGLGSSLQAQQTQPQTSDLQIQAPPLPAGPITLEQALALAGGRSESIAIAQAGIRRAEGEEIRAKAGMFPQLAASFAYDRSLASEFDGVFEVDPDTNPDGGTDAFADLPFGRANVWRANIEFSQLVYSGGRVDAARDLASAGREAAGLTLTTAQAQLLFDVTQAYFDAALSERLGTIAEASLEQAGATLRQTQAGFDAGTQPEFEVLRARVSRDNQTPLVIRQRVNRDVALLRLKQLLDIPAEFELRLTETLSDEGLAPPPMFAAQVASIESAMRTVDWAAFTRDANASLPVRTAVSEAAAAVKLREASLRLAEAQRAPTVEVNSIYSRIAYPTDFLPTFDRTNWTVGARINVPILTGGRQRGDEAVARAELDQARIQRRQVEELASLDTRSAWAELMAAKATWEASSGTVQQAARAFQIADVRYGAGVSTQLELTDSRLLLQQAEANRAQAARDLQVARARVALLPNLPLGTGTGGAAPRQSVPQVPASPAPPDENGPFIRNARIQGSQTTQGTR